MTKQQQIDSETGLAAKDANDQFRRPSVAQEVLSISVLFEIIVPSLFGSSFLWSLGTMFSSCQSLILPPACLPSSLSIAMDREVFGYNKPRGSLYDTLCACKMSKATTLVAVDGVSITFAEIGEVLEREFGTDAFQCVFADGKWLSGPKEKFQRVVCFVAQPLPLEQLVSLRSACDLGATVVFHSAPENRDALRRNCVLSGFLPCDEESAVKLLRVKTPMWEAGAKTAVKVEPPKRWTVAVDDDDDDEILDDDAFLTEEDLKPAPRIEGGKMPVKKACDNCTCGRAEGKEPVKLTQEMLDNPVTSCGSCSLGDAYRCASCPYRGLPAFEPGKKIELPEGFLISDV